MNQSKQERIVLHCGAPLCLNLFWNGGETNFEVFCKDCAADRVKVVFSVVACRTVRDLQKKTTIWWERRGALKLNSNQWASHFTANEGEPEEQQWQRLVSSLAPGINLVEGRPGVLVVCWFDAAACLKIPSPSSKMKKGTCDAACS